jgi:hypothetical protein
MATDAFGMPTDETATDMDAAFGDGDQPGDEAEAPVEQTTTEVEVETNDDETATDETPEGEGEEAEEAPEGETAEEEAERLFAGKFKSAEELEKGYREIVALQTRTARERAEALEQVRQREEYLRVAAQELQRRQQAAQQPQPTASDIEREAAAMGLDPETYVAAQKLAQQQVEQRLAPIEQQMTAQQQQAPQAQQQQAEREREIAAVREVATTWVESKGDALDDTTWQNVVAVFSELNLDETEPEFYDVAYEAATNPALRETLKALPDLADSDDGMALARKLAGNADTQQAGKTRRPRPKAHVETGGSGAVPSGAPADDGNDPWKAVTKLAASEKEGASSVLGV